jgi:signal transduction histidine kinase
VAEEMKGSLAQLGEEGRSIVVQATPDLVVRADRDHFQRIFANYATNAVKYGGPPIVAEASRIPSFVEVCVKDQGPGVPEIFVNRLFSKFARAETEATRSSEGTGLGLSIVRGLAQANGGDTWYEPNSPSGSCFGVRLPSGG